MSSFQQTNGSFFAAAAGLPVTSLAPTSGSTITMAWNQRDLYLAPAATLAALTIKLPAAPNPGDWVHILSTAAITALTLDTGLGASIPNAPSSMSAGGTVTMRYVSSAVGWVHWPLSN